MATATVNYTSITSGTTANWGNSTRSIADLTTAEGTNLSIIKLRIPYQRRRIEASNKFLFYIASDNWPLYMPKAGQKVLIHHLDVPASGVLDALLTEKSTNVAAGTFIRPIQMPNTPSTVRSRDNFIYAFEISYDDDIIGRSPGDCIGAIEYDTSPTIYDILKPIENSVVVSERVTFDGSDGANYLIGSSTGSSDPAINISPMLFIGSGDSNTVFSNLYRSFNLPIITADLDEYRQTTLGYWTTTSAGDLYYNGLLGTWTSGGTATMVHPVTGYTGMFYGTVYQHLAFAGTGKTAVDKILVMEIPQVQYGEIIDGKTLKVQLPKTGGTSMYSIYGAYKKNIDELALGKMDNYMSEHDLSASHFGVPPQLGSTTYESNVVLLFCDDIKRPMGDTGKTWSDGHTEVMDGEKVYSPTSVLPKEFFDFYEDQCVGIAYLDRGFVVITDPTIVTEVFSQFTGSTYGNISTAENTIVNYVTGSTVDWDNSQFLFTDAYMSGYTGNTTFVEYLSYNTEKSVNIICLASANEFYRTTNTTAKDLLNVMDADYAEFKNPISGNLLPIVITEIGLHDAAGNLLAIAKPTEPIRKYWYEITSFSVKIRL